MGQRDAAEFAEVAEHAFVAVGMRVQESAEVVPQVAVVLQPTGKGLAHFPGADDERTGLSLAFLRAMQDEPTLRVSPSGKRENVDHARENHNEPGNFLIPGGEDEEHQKRGGDSDGFGDANGFHQGAQLARGAIEALADAAQENERAVKNQESWIGLQRDVADHLSGCYDGVPTVGEPETQAVNQQRAAADKQHVDDGVGRLAGESTLRPPFAGVEDGAGVLIGPAPRVELQRRLPLIGRSSRGASCRRSAHRSHNSSAPDFTNLTNFTEILCLLPGPGDFPTRLDRENCPRFRRHPRRAPLRRFPPHHAPQAR